MPCNSDHLEATNREAYNRLTAQLIVYLNGRSASAKEKADAANYYGGADYTAQLCAMLTAMSTEDADRLVYDGRNPMARKLADWWEEHQKADKMRRNRERRDAEK
jgi:hypothetical protein